MPGLRAPTYSSDSTEGRQEAPEDIMTTTYDAESTCDTIAAVYYDDPDTYTIAEAWMSSPLGKLDDDITDAYVSADPVDDRDRGGSRGKLFAAVAAGIIGGATLGAVLFGYRPVVPPTVVVPGFGVSTEQLPGTSTTPSSPQTPRAAQAPAPKQLPQSPPNPVAAEPAAPPVIEAPILDPAMKKPTTNELTPVPSSRFRVNLPNKKPDDGPHRQVPSSRFNSLGKP
jgi:hypothetical protein